MNMILSPVKEIVLDVLFPPTCITCGSPDGWMCEECLQGIRVHQKGVLAIGSYSDPILRTLVTRLKYEAASCLMPTVEDLLRRFRDGRLEPWPWAGVERLTIVSIPPDAGRLRERGFDHVSRFADAVWKRLVPWAVRKEALIRVERRLPNADLPANAAREANVRGMFCALGKIQGPVLLVDDVMTTGATLNEAATVLKEAGATAVYFFVMAKG